MRISVATLALALLPVMAPAVSAADILMDASGDFGPEPESEVRSFEIEIGSGDATFAPYATAELTDGRLAVRLLGPEGGQLREHSGVEYTVEGDILHAGGKVGNYTIEVAPEEAIGTWSIRLLELPRLPGSLVYLAPGIGMVLVAVAAALLWKSAARA